ncbi:flavin-binding protein [Spirosoma harenae]
MSQAPSSEKPTQSTPIHNLADLESACWHQLISGAEHKADGFRTMTVATCTNRGADARTTVLRKVDAVHKYVWFHTDARAEKVLQLEAFPLATLLFWDKERHIQLRLTIETRLHTDDYIADEHWESISDREKKLYFSEYIPGTEIPEPYLGYSSQLDSQSPSAELLKIARDNFATIECRVLTMEYLYLLPEGQLRARFQYEPESKMVWLAP